MVGLSGGAAGLSLSYLLEFVINSLMSGASSTSAAASSVSGVLSVSLSSASGSLVVIPAELALFALALATCIGVCAGLYPALRAARMLPVLALKSD